MLRYALGLILLISNFTHAGVNAIGEPNVTWLKNSIHVCWHSGAMDNPAYVKNDLKLEEKKAVQKIVEQEYSIERVGINFFGWEECSTLSSDQIDLAIYQDNELSPSNEVVQPYRNIKVEGYSIIGQGSAEQINNETKEEGFFNRDLQPSIMYLQVRPLFRIFSNNFKSIEELQLTALHEFGHVAGLEHEHIREEAKTDPNCKSMAGFNLQQEPVLATAVMYETYDPNSIMNYCWNTVLALNGIDVSVLPNLPDHTLYTETTNIKTNKKNYLIKIGLSSKDIATLNKLYPKN